MSVWRVLRTFALWGPMPAALALAVMMALGAADALVPAVLLTYFVGLVPAVAAALVFHLLLPWVQGGAPARTKAMGAMLGAAAGAAVGVICHVLLASSRVYPSAPEATGAVMSFLVPFVLPGALGGLMAGARCGWLLADHASELKT
jgi:hypothetical protein